MFEKIGYKLVSQNDTYVKYECTKYGSTRWIEIWKSSKNEPCLIRKEYLQFDIVINYHADEIQAINKQIEERGWLDVKN